MSDDGMESGSRSKRTCVRVREEISKLEEILKDDTPDGKSSLSSKQKGRGKGRGTSARASAAVEQSADASADGLGGVAHSAKKYKRPAYSQFTHKRRKRKRKAPEEGMWVRGVLCGLEGAYVGTGPQRKVRGLGGSYVSTGPQRKVRGLGGTKVGMNL